MHIKWGLSLFFRSKHNNYRMLWGMLFFSVLFSMDRGDFLFGEAQVEVHFGGELLELFFHLG